MCCPVSRPTHLLVVGCCCCLLQVRQLREELLAARRDRAVGEAREAELRRELSTIKRQVGSKGGACVVRMGREPQAAPAGRAHIHTPGSLVLLCTRVAVVTTAAVGNSWRASLRSSTAAWLGSLLRGSGSAPPWNWSCVLPWTSLRCTAGQMMLRLRPLWPLLPGLRVP